MIIRFCFSKTREDCNCLFWRASHADGLERVEGSVHTKFAAGLHFPVPENPEFNHFAIRQMSGCALRGWRPRGVSVSDFSVRGSLSTQMWSRSSGLSLQQCRSDVLDICVVLTLNLPKSLLPSFLFGIALQGYLDVDTRFWCLSSVWLLLNLAILRAHLSCGSAPKSPAVAQKSSSAFASWILTVSCRWFHKRSVWSGHPILKEIAAVCSPLLI